MMDDPERGVWWHTRPVAGRIEVSHGPTVDGTPEAPRAIVMVSLPAALELAVGLVHACLDIDSEATQARMLALWVRESESP